MQNNTRYLRLLLPVLLGFSPLARALTSDEANARFRVVNQMAREMNDSSLVEKIRAAAKLSEKLIKSGDQAKAEVILRELETQTGIDPGGWSMQGMPILKPSAEMDIAMKALAPELDAAMRGGDAARVTEVCRKLIAVLGPQAGTPDARRKGERAEPQSIEEAAATRLFVDGMKSEGKMMRAITSGKPVKDQMLRTYAYAVSAICEAHALIAKHAPADLADCERVIRGGCQIMLALQQPEGHFPFPDLRGKSIRFGAMTDRFVAEQGGKVVDGWLVTADPTGGTQFDTGLCGAALLQAGTLLHEEAWTRAGLRAAEWAARQPCSTNFNYNAFSVTLLAQAFKATNDSQHLDAALKKWRVGVAPGQAPNGRWADPHNARTVYHHIIVRAMNDLMEALPSSRAAERDEVRVVLSRAMKPLLDEFTALGVTVHCLRELVRYRDQSPEKDGALNKAIDESVSVMLSKCKRAGQARMGVAPTEFPWLPKAVARRP